VQTIQEALSEITLVARIDPLLGAEGAVTLLERLSPVLENVDSSSGAIGTAVQSQHRGTCAGDRCGTDGCEHAGRLARTALRGTRRRPDSVH
jgi:hypothetical protein